MVRFAPSPTREFTIEDLRVALLNYIVAKQRGDRFLIRFDDIEKDRKYRGVEIVRFMLILGESFAITPMKLPTIFLPGRPNNSWIFLPGDLRPFKGA